MFQPEIIEQAKRLGLEIEEVIRRKADGSEASAFEVAHPDGMTWRFSSPGDLTAALRLAAFMCNAGPVASAPVVPTESQPVRVPDAASSGEAWANDAEPVAAESIEPVSGTLVAGTPKLASQASSAFANRQSHPGERRSASGRAPVVAAGRTLV